MLFENRWLTTTAGPAVFIGNPNMPMSSLLRADTAVRPYAEIISRYVSWCYKQRFCDDVAEPANVFRESLVNDNDWFCGFDWKSEHGNVIVTTGGHGGPPLGGNSFALGLVVLQTTLL